MLLNVSYLARGIMNKTQQITNTIQKHILWKKTNINKYIEKIIYIYLYSLTQIILKIYIKCGFLEKHVNKEYMENKDHI